MCQCLQQVAAKSDWVSYCLWRIITCCPWVVVSHAWDRHTDTTTTRKMFYKRVKEQKIVQFEMNVDIKQTSIIYSGFETVPTVLVRLNGCVCVHHMYVCGKQFEAQEVGFLATTVLSSYSQNSIKWWSRVRKHNTLEHMSLYHQNAHWVNADGTVIEKKNHLLIKHFRLNYLSICLKIDVYFICCSKVHTGLKCQHTVQSFLPFVLPYTWLIIHESQSRRFDFILQRHLACWVSPFKDIRTLTLAGKKWDLKYQFALYYIICIHSCVSTELLHGSVLGEAAVVHSVVTETTRKRHQKPGPLQSTQ